MTTESHKMESVSSIGKDDDPGFEANFLNKRSRTESFLQKLQKAKSAVANRTLPSIEDLQAVQDAHLLQQCQNRLLQRITGIDVIAGVRRTCGEWYLAYLDARITEVWPTIAFKVLQGAGTDATTASITDMMNVYEILLLIARSIEERSIKDRSTGDDHECTLKDMVTELREKGLIKDDDDPLAVQLVFHCFGWLTAIFDPSPDPSATHLLLRKPKDQARRRKLVRKTGVRQLSVVMSDANRPIQQLLRRFGSLLPEAECIRRSQQAGGLEAGPECIIAAYISFHSLQQVLKIDIEWVDVLNQHLEFDQRKRVLRVFRLPSICRLMYRDEEGTLLNRLFREDEKERDEGPRSPHSHLANIEDFLVEIILSYRLIFGRDRRSRSRIRRILEEEKSEWEDEGLCDPLLEILCTRPDQSQEMQELYNDLESKEFEDYIWLEEFPFLARRLFDLQRFSMAQNPHSWRRLWNDQRNITVWFTTWAVVIIGGGTLLFQVLQLVFQIYQPLQNNGP